MVLCIIKKGIIKLEIQYIVNLKNQLTYTKQFLNQYFHNCEMLRSFFRLLRLGNKMLPK